MKKSIFKGKSTRTKIFSVITIVGILLLLGLNFVLTYFGGTRLFMTDMTREASIGTDTIARAMTARGSAGTATTEMD